jgi:CrcB protein
VRRSGRFALTILRAGDGPRQEERPSLSTLVTYLWIALGGALGSVARYGCSSLAARLVGETFPWGTLIINVVGSLVIGFFATLTGPDGRVLAPPDTRQLVMVGLCGGYTTFSSFSLQTLNLVRDGDMLAAAGNIVGSVVLCLLAVWLGHIAAAALNQTR